jgi:hypothetical protein
VAKKPGKSKPQVTQKHVDNANEIAQLMAAMKQAQGADTEQQAPDQAPAMPSGMSPLGGMAK